MKYQRRILVPIMICGLLGCQSGPGVTIVEYRPRTAPAEHNAPASEVFELVRWQPIAPVTPATMPLAAPAKQMPVEVEQVYAARGSPVGFRRDGGQLIAIAGPTTKPLIEAHYEWKTMPGHPSDQSETARRRSERFFGTIASVVAIAAIIALVVYLDGKDCQN